MAELEVKKSWFVALDTSAHASLAADASATAIAAVTDFKSSREGSGTAEDRTAFLLEPSGLPDLSFDYEEVTRDVIRNSYLPAAPLRGVINTTGSMTVELHGGSQSYTNIKYPDYHPLLESAFGQYNEGPATTVTVESTDLSGTAATGTTIGGTATDTSAVSVGDIIVLEDDTDGYIVVAQVLTSNATTGTLLVMDASSSLATARSFTSINSVAYSMPTSSSGIPNFAIAYYRANVVREIYAKCACTSLEFPFSAGEIVLPVFNFNVGDGGIAEQVYYTSASVYDALYGSGVTNTLTSSDADPLFAKAVTWKFEVHDDSADTWYDLTKTVDSFSITINNESSTVRDITATEGIKSYGMQGRTVDLTLSAYYDDDTFATHNITNMFLDDANNRVRISAHTGSIAGNRCFLFSPSMQFKTTVSEDAGLFKYDVTGTAEKEETFGFGENALVCVFY